jgi:hypothetical protein
MKFEWLPNELILDIFEYLNAIHLLRAFYGLNSRLNNVINTSIKVYHLDFRFISKFDFDIIYQQYHRLIIDKVVSIHIADDDETPNLPEIFFSRNFIPSSFIHLQSLSFYSIRSLELLNNTILHCYYLPCLTHLKFIQCLLNDTPPDTINTIWSIPKLTNLHIDENMSKGICFSRILETSSSIKYLSIKNVNCDLRNLSNILQRTPYLQRLSTTIICTEKNEKLTTTIPLLTKLILSFRGSVETIINLFQQMINLCSLTLHTSHLLLNGNEWKDILLNYLPNLKNFQLKMDFHFPQCDYIEDKIDELLDTFQTDFWLKKHQWFVRCNRNPINPFNQAILYTLPYAFKDFHFTNELYSKSTCSNKENFWSYNHVKTLQYEGNLSNNLQYFPIQFPNISHLEIILPFNDKFLSNIPLLNHLISLDVTLLPGDFVYYQLQTLLNRAPHLYLLRFSHLSDLEMILFQITNSSIHRLDFFTKESMLYSWYFNRRQCLTLANSSLGQQCQTLVIDIENRIYILDLINNMSNLQSLTFQCKDDKWNNNNKILSTTNDELVQWLHEHLPSTCEIFRHNNQTSILQIWIR